MVAGLNQLNNAIVKAGALIDGSGALIRQSTLKSITPREIDLSVFAIPDGYKVQDLHQAVAGLFGLHLPARCSSADPNSTINPTGDRS